MKNLRYVIAGGLLAGALCFPAMPVSADPKENREYPGWHKGWEKNHHGSAKGHDKKWKDCDHHEAVYRERDRHGDHYYSKDFHHTTIPATPAGWKFDKMSRTCGRPATRFCTIGGNYRRMSKS